MFGESVRDVGVIQSWDKINGALLDGPFPGLSRHEHQQLRARAAGRIAYLISGRPNWMLKDEDRDDMDALRKEIDILEAAPGRAVESTATPE